jgi:outer membrane protein OmpA-like peptidoglycan-associated protein
VLLGFAEGSADSGRISLEEARAVAAELEERGVKAEIVEGLGSLMPLSSSDVLRNRRVEVWIRDAS